MKFKSQLPSVTPSARVLVRFPVHVSLRVEVALPLNIVLETSEKMHASVRRFNIAHNPKKVARIGYFTNHQDYLDRLLFWI
jgi:hypothetical protein